MPCKLKHKRAHTENKETAIEESKIAPYFIYMIQLVYTWKAYTASKNTHESEYLNSIVLSPLYKVFQNFKDL